MRYDAVVFDNDGVLTTPTRHEALREAMTRAFDSVGVGDPSVEDLDTLINPTVDGLREVAAKYDVDPDEFWKKRERAAIDVQYEEIREGRKVLYEDVPSLDALSVPRSIVSNNQQETIQNVVDHFELDGFDPCYGREPTVKGIERKKPTPYYLRRALDELGAENPLYVGDSRVDVVAADALGVDSAFIWREHRRGYELDVEPTIEIDSLEALLEIAKP